METQFEKLTITPHDESTQILSNEFVNIMDKTKKKKQAAKVSIICSNFIVFILPLN